MQQAIGVAELGPDFQAHLDEARAPGHDLVAY
jgi:hypothetical protein